MNNLPTDSICQMEEFLKSNDFIEMEITSKKDRYEFIKEDQINGVRYLFSVGPIASLLRTKLMGSGTFFRSALLLHCCEQNQF